jgi:hypothetical protein
MLMHQTQPDFIKSTQSPKKQTFLLLSFLSTAHPVQSKSLRNQQKTELVTYSEIVKNMAIRKINKNSKLLKSITSYSLKTSSKLYYKNQHSPPSYQPYRTCTSCTGTCTFWFTVSVDGSKEAMMVFTSDGTTINWKRSLASPDSFSWARNSALVQALPDTPGSPTSSGA